MNRLLSFGLILLAAYGGSAACLGADQPGAGGADLATCRQRGQILYVRSCFVCHQLNGQGIPGTFPPLAGSDFLASQWERSVRALCEGLTGEVQVNGQTFAGAMPPAMLDDQEVADVMTFVTHSWGNVPRDVTAQEVSSVRRTTRFKTFGQLQRASVYPPLPKAPKGFVLREVARLPIRGVRMASDGQGRVIYVLAEGGDVWRVEVASGRMRQILWGERYLEKRPGDLGGPLFVLGMALDSKGRLYIACNQQNEATLPVRNVVTIYRTTESAGGDPAEPKPWFETSYPGSPAYIHAVENIAFGPDGMLYVGNGARTDGGQSGKEGGRYFAGAETPITACLWRLDPNAKKPTLEVYARGIRNAYGFCWNDQGEMFATENGPDAHAPEELNLIEQGNHYGFPYQFANWTQKAYSHTPDAPEGLEFTLPIPNLGPDGGFKGEPTVGVLQHARSIARTFASMTHPEPGAPV